MRGTTLHYISLGDGRTMIEDRHGAAERPTADVAVTFEEEA